MESLLFASGESVSLKDMAKVLWLEEKTCEKLALQLQRIYEEKASGIQLERFENRFQMSTRPTYYPAISVLYQSNQKIKLTDTQIETLAIIVYKQPVTRQEVSDIRGVASDNVVGRLIQLGLVEEAGRMRAPGRPILLKTTDRFLRVFGLESVKDLPRLPKQEKMPEKTAPQKMTLQEALALEEMEQEARDAEEAEET